MVSNPKEFEGEGEKKESKNKAHRIYKGTATQMTENLSAGTHGKQSCSGPILLKQLQENNILSKAFIAREK